jgi:hypothetical protein
MPSISRETTVQSGAVAVAFAVLVLSGAAVSEFDLGSRVGMAVSVVFNAVVFGGAHLYLAARGEDGSVPVASRWRFLAALGVVAAAALLAIAFGPRVETAVGVDVRGIGFAFVAVVGLAYLVAEARAGYRDARDAE